MGIFWVGFALNLDVNQHQTETPIIGMPWWPYVPFMTESLEQRSLAWTKKKALERWVGSFLLGGALLGWFTIPKINIAAPENGWLEDDRSFWDGIFSGTMLVSGRVSFRRDTGFWVTRQQHEERRETRGPKQRITRTRPPKHHATRGSGTKGRQHHTTGKQLPRHKTGSPQLPLSNHILFLKLWACRHWFPSRSRWGFYWVLHHQLKGSGQEQQELMFRSCASIDQESRLVCTWLGSVSLLCFASFSCLLCSSLCASALLSSVPFFCSALLPLPFFFPRCFLGCRSLVCCFDPLCVPLVCGACVWWMRWLLHMSHWWMRGHSQPINSEIRLHFVPLFGLGSRPPEGDGLVNL